ncbi:CPBP family intramembrane metalloprotease [bacterium]|nr:CPBP family intramembrane metalloprotease [bacterium]
MNWKKVTIVYRKEIKDTLRDKRTVMMMILVPILLYPLLFTTMGQLMTTGTKKLEAQKSVIALNDSLPDMLVGIIGSEDHFEITFQDDPVEAIREKSIQGYLTSRTKEDTLQYVVYFDAAIDKSRLCQERLSDVLDIYREEIQTERLSKKSLDLSILHPFEIDLENIAPPSRMGGMFLGSILPMLLIVTMVLGAMYPAIDLTAGEKERGTLETILTIPVQRLELLFGKFLTVTTTAFITGLLNLASMMLVYTSGMVQMGEISKHLEFGITPFGLLCLIFSLIPFALFISAAIISVCLFARSFKEAQNFVTPVYLLIMFPTFIAMMPGVELNRSLALIPVVNISLLFREIFLNNYPTELISLTFISNAIIAVVFIVVVVKLFNAESILFGEGQSVQLSLNRSQIRPVPRLLPSSALLVFAMVMLLLFYAGSYIQLRFGSWGIFATEWGLIFIPVILALWFLKCNLKQSLNIGKVHALSVLGTLFMGLGAFGAVTLVSRIQMELFPEAMEVMKSLEKILNMSDTSMHPAIGYLIFAFSPAVCEEVLFRGVLLSSFKKHIPAWMAVVLVGFLFGVFHVYLIRILPTALLGILFAYIVYRTGSIWTSILAHFVHNGLAFTLINTPDLVEKFPWLTSEAWPTAPVIMLMTGLLVAGLVLIELGCRMNERISAGNASMEPID